MSKKNFHELLRVVPLKYFMYFLAGINTKQFLNILEEKIFGPWKFLCPFSKSLASSFSFFFCSSWKSILPILFLILNIKLPISFLFAKSSCPNLAVKFSDVNLLNPWAIIYLSWSWSVNFLAISLIFVLNFFWLSY